MSRRRADRARTSQEAVDEQVERDLAEFVSVQQQAGLDLLTDGMLRWQDIFRPMLEATEGLETGALTRFLDTNTFYRAPHATTATPKLPAPLGERHIAPLPGPRLVTLPSPFALSQGTGVPALTIAEDVLKPALDEVNADLVVLAEPFFGRAEDASQATLAGPPPQAGPLALQLTFATPVSRSSRPSELPVDATASPYAISGRPEGLRQALRRALDARSSTPEDSREIASFAEAPQRA